MSGKAVDALHGFADAGSGLKSKLKSLPQAIRRTAARAFPPSAGLVSVGREMVLPQSCLQLPPLFSGAVPETKQADLEDMRPIQYRRSGNAFHEIVFRLYVRPPEIERIATVILVALA